MDRSKGGVRCDQWLVGGVIKLSNRKNGLMLLECLSGLESDTVGRDRWMVEGTANSWSMLLRCTGGDVVVVEAVVV